MERKGSAVPLGRPDAQRGPGPHAACTTAKTPTDGRIVTVQQAHARRRCRSSRCTRPPASTRGSSTRSALINAGRRPGRGRRRELTPALLRLAKRHGFCDAQLASLRGYAGGGRPRRAARPRGAPGLQDRRHLRGRVRRARRRTTTATYDEETEVAPRERPAVIILGSGPNRIGQGVEFDYSCVHASFALRDAGLRHGDGQLQPRDGLHRLRHQQPALLRAAHPRGRPRGRARRAAGRAGRRRHRPARRPDPARARAGAQGRPASRSSGTSPEAIDLAEDRGAFGRVLAEAQPAGAQARHRLQRGRGRRGRHARSATRCSSARPTCSAGAAWRSSTTTRRWPPTSPAPPSPAPSTRCSSTGSSTTRSRSTSTRSTTATEMYLGGIMEHIEEAGIHSGDSACTLPPVTLGRDRARAGPRVDPQAGPGHRRPRADERPVRAGPGHPLRARGQPAGVAHGAVRRQGHRRADRQGGGPGDARRDASRSCARRACCRRTATAARCRATRRSRSRRRSCRSSGSAPRTARSSTRCSARRCAPPVRSWASTSDFGTAFAKSQLAARRACRDDGPVFVSVANRDKRAMIFPVKRLADLGFTIIATSGTADVLRRNGIQSKVVRKHSERRQRRSASRPSSTSSSTARSPWWSTRRRGRRRPRRRLRDPRRDDRDGQADHHHGPGAGRRGAGHRGPDAGRVHRQVAAGPRPRPRPLRRRHGASAEGPRERGDHAAYRAGRRRPGRPAS